MSVFAYGSRSRSNLVTCHSVLQRIAFRALERSPIDITIIHGWRDAATQNDLVAQGLSRTPWPQSKHNAMDSTGSPESLALDFAPWINNAVTWKDTHSFAVVAGVFMAAAHEVDERIRWGGDWDLDGLTTDQSFMDFGHIELVR